MGERGAPRHDLDLVSGRDERAHALDRARRRSIAQEKLVRMSRVHETAKLRVRKRERLLEVEIAHRVKGAAVAAAVCCLLYGGFYVLTN